MAQQTQAQAIAANKAARQALLATATPMRKNLGASPLFTAGQTCRFQLNNVGIMTSIDAVVNAVFNITVITTISSVGLEALITLVKFTDFDNTDRVIITARHLAVLNSVRQRRLFNLFTVTDVGDSVPTTSQTARGQAILNQVTTAVNAAAPIRFDIHIPLAYDPNSDLRGAVLAQTIRGQQFVTFGIAAAISGANMETVYSAGTAAIVSVQFTVFQNYLQPQAINGQLPLPLQDLLTVYELNGNNQTNTGLAVNQALHLYYPNVRQVLSTIHTYVNNGVLNYATDVASIILQANSNTNLREYLGLDLLSKQRNLIGADLLPGTYYIDTRRVPVDTQLFGNVQLLFTPSVVNAGDLYVESTYESFYLKGTSLPGINVA